MKTRTITRKIYEKPEVRVIPMVKKPQLLVISNYDGAEID